VRTVQTRLLCVIDGLLLQFSITKHLNKTNYSVVATAIAMVCLPPAAAVLHRHVFEEEGKIGLTPVHRQKPPVFLQVGAMYYLTPLHPLTY